MDRRAAALLFTLSLVALLLAVGAAAEDDIIRLPGGDAVMEESRPWTCCDNPVCTNVGICACKDVVKECSCNTCKPVPGGFMCRDASAGGATPKCTDAGN